MEVSKDLKKLKKMYGENFMKLCRSLFPTLLEQEGRLYEILSLSFSDNCKTLYEDIVKAGSEEKFKSYIYSKVDVEYSEKKIIEEKTPYELLKEVGYNLTECLTEEEIQKFKKYYEPCEKLCTFLGGRLNRCVVFWAVKENVEDIKREEFKNPKREDEYGTSVMGIQFNKQGICTVSIKNRYNHTVNNPDATYGNNLDRIIPGLTKSFGALLKKEYGLELNSSNIERFEIPGYVVANDGKYYRYNMEIGGNYYCPGNIVIKQGGEVTSVGNPEECLLIDYFYIDKNKKKIEVYGNIEDSFVDDLQKIDKIDVVKAKEENVNRAIRIYLQDIEQPVLIGIDKRNQIVKYVNKNVTNVGHNFLMFNKGLTKLEMPNLTQVGHDFLCSNEGLTKLEMPNLTQARDRFLYKNEGLIKLEIPNLTQVGHGFLYSNEGLTQLEMSNLTEAGNNFLYFNEGLMKLEMPNLTKAGADFLYFNQKLTELEMPNLTEVGDYFLGCNEGLTQLEVPNLTKTGKNFLYFNEGLTELVMPKLIKLKEHFSEIIDRNISQKSEEKIITVQNIAKLDKDSKLTTTELNYACNIIKKIKTQNKDNIRKR